jgi:transposase
LSQALKQINVLHEENQLLRQQLEWLKKQLFGSGKSEKLDKSQLGLGIDDEASEAPAAEAVSVPSYERKRRAPIKTKEQSYAHLPIKHSHTIIPDEVKSNPEAYEQIGEERTFELGITAPQIYRIEYIRPRYRLKADKSQPPVIAPALARAVQGIASASLLAHILLSKYVDHLPLHRQRKMLQRQQVRLCEQSMGRWVGRSAEVLEPIYNRMHQNLIDGDYLQIDETPIKVIDPDYPNNKTRSGWLWPISRPAGDVVFTWSMTRGSSHLDELLAGFSGYLQSDAYGVYDKYAREREGIVLSACMAHIRRQFDKAKEQSQDAQRVLERIAPLYRIEKELREAGADHAQIERTRQAESLPILEDLQKQLIKVRQAHLPKSLTGKACDYALSIWDKAKVYCQRGDLQIDNNLIENAIRPSAIGKKNWLFVGHPNAGKRSAIIYSIVISCQRHGICPGQYLETVLADQNLLRRQDPTGLTPAEMAPQF